MFDEERRSSVVKAQHLHKGVVDVAIQDVISDGIPRPPAARNAPPDPDPRDGL